MRPAAAGDLLFVEPLENGAPVSDAPYTAEAITETTQVLADGNRINRQSSVRWRATAAGASGASTRR